MISSLGKNFSPGALTADRGRHICSTCGKNFSVSTSSGVEHRHAKTTIESERLNWSVPGQYPGLTGASAHCANSQHAPHSMAAGNPGCCRIRGLVVNSSRAGVVPGLDVDLSDSHFTARNSQARTPGQQQFGGECFVPDFRSASNLPAACRWAV